MNKKPLYLANFLVFSTIFFTMVFTVSPVLYFSCFVLILARGIHLFVTMAAFETRARRRGETGDHLFVEQKGRRPIWPLLMTAVALQLLPVALVIADFYILFLRKDWWTDFF